MLYTNTPGKLVFKNNFTSMFDSVVRRTERQSIMRRLKNGSRSFKIYYYAQYVADVTF